MVNRRIRSKATFNFYIFPALGWKSRTIATLSFFYPIKKVQLFSKIAITYQKVFEHIRRESALGHLIPIYFTVIPGPWFFGRQLKIPLKLLIFAIILLLSF